MHVRPLSYAYCGFCVQHSLEHALCVYGSSNFLYIQGLIERNLEGVHFEKLLAVHFFSDSLIGLYNKQGQST